MGWSKAMMLAVLLGLGTGCPEEWRKGGVMDRAAAKDIKENLAHPCADDAPRVWRCAEDEPEESCGWRCPE